jgi:hypothetical protein
MSDPNPSVSDPAQLSSYAKRSYRYLRLAVVVVLLALIASVLLERAHASCWEGSISAYYYTPVHSIFVGALVAMGVCLIAIRGSTDAEDVLLNVAGVLAPVVALVPTALPTDMCTKHEYDGGDTLPFVNNNLVALGIALVAAMLIGIVTILRADRDRRPKFDSHVAWGFVLSGVILAVGIIWYAAFRSSFLDHAHGGGAAVLFFLVGVVVLINGLSAPNRKYRRGYLSVAVAMAVAFVGVVIVGVVDRDWRHQVLWLELLELSLLVAFWSMQTAELWDAGVPTGDDREQRTDEVRAKLPVIGAKPDAVLESH